MRTVGLPPGPRWPAIFQTVSLLRSGQAFIDRAAQRYGDLFTIRTWIFGTQVMTSDPELIKQAFTGDTDVLQAGAANSSAPMITGRLSVLTIDGAPHRRARKLLTPPFHGERMAAYAESMRAITRRVMSTWRVGEAFPLLPSFQRITLEVIVATIFGLEDGPRRALFADKVAAMMNVATTLLNIFFFLVPRLQKDLGPLTRWKRLKAQWDDHEALIRGEIAARRRAHAGQERSADDVLALLLEARDEDGAPMPDEEIRDQLVTLLIAGHETTASSLAWAFERILATPEVRDRLVAELDGAVLAGKSSAADLAALPYLDATLKEVLRQRPTVPMLGRKLTQPMKLRDYEIPAGAMVTPSVNLTHQRPDLYPEPERFRPDRFLDKKIDPYTYFPFGGGPRRCLGAAFATMEMKIVVGTILQELELRLARDAPLAPAPRSIFVTPEGGAEVVLEGARRVQLGATALAAPARART
jgi:cytochrome P450